MKRIFLTFAIVVMAISFSAAQKFAYVNTDYILEKIPEYSAAKAQLDALSEQWQKEVEQGYVEIEELYKRYQADRVLLTEDMRRKREDEIIQKEQGVKELQNKYFGQEGDLYKKRQELIKPIQDKVFNAIREYAEIGKYAMILDAAGNANMLYADPAFDKSDDILKKLGVQ